MSIGDRETPFNPYAPPKAAPGYQPEGFGLERRFVRDPSQLTSTLVTLLWVSLAVDVYALIATAVAYMQTNEPNVTEIPIGQGNSIFSIVSMGVTLVTAFVFLKWIYRANLNVRGFGVRNLTVSPGWSVGYFFVPILNLWRPYSAMKEIYRASRNPAGWVGDTGSGPLPLWWTLWIGTGLINQFAGMVLLRAASLEAYRSALIFQCIALLSSILLCLVAIQVVREIYQLQRAWVAGPEVPEI